MEHTTIDSYGDVRIVGNNAAGNYALSRRKSGMSSHMKNKLINRLPRSMDAVRSGCSDN